MKETITNKDALGYSSAFLNPAAWEKLNQPLFDTLIYPGEGSAQLSFFQIPVRARHRQRRRPRKAMAKPISFSGANSPPAKPSSSRPFRSACFWEGKTFAPSAGFIMARGSASHRKQTDQTGQAADLREGVTEPEISRVFEPAGHRRYRDRQNRRGLGALQDLALAICS